MRGREYIEGIDDMPEIVGRRNRVIARMGGMYGDRLPDPLPLRVGKAISQMYSDIPQDYVLNDTQAAVDPQLHSALHDLSLLIVRDVKLAAEAAYYGTEYAGVDEGIEPVSDEHVALVIWATQRELTRERRPPLGADYREGKLPAVQLAEFPWAIQRAFAERRRKHYTDYGIGKFQWENNYWTVEGVQEDPMWIPPWVDLTDQPAPRTAEPPQYDPWGFFP